MSSCKKYEKGKIICWDIDNFKFYNVTESLIEDTKIFCAQVEEICIFPERIFCQDHGGYLFTPRNEKENANVLEKLKPFISTFFDASSESVAKNIHPLE